MTSWALAGRASVQYGHRVHPATAETPGSFVRHNRDTMADKRARWAGLAQLPPGPVPDRSSGHTWMDSTPSSSLVWPRR